MNEPTIIAKGKPTIKNALQFLVYTIGFVLLLMMFIIYMLVTFYYTTTMYGDAQAILMLSLQKAIFPTALIIFLYFLILFILDYRRLKKRDLLNKETIFFINQEGIAREYGHIQEKTDWSNILKIKEYKSLFLFRHSLKKWSFLPKHYFQTEADLARFQELVKAYRTNSSNLLSKQTNSDTEFIENDSINFQESSIVVKGNFTFKDYNRYAFLFHRKLILIYIVLIIFWCGLILSPETIWNLASPNFLLFLFLLIGAGAFLLYFILQRHSLKEYNSDPLSKKEKVYVFDEEGLSYSPGNSFIQLKWQDFRKVREHKKLLLFYTQPQQALIIPLRLFETPEDVEKVKRLIKEHMNSKQIKFEN